MKKFWCFLSYPVRKRPKVSTWHVFSMLIACIERLHIDILAVLCMPVVVIFFLSQETRFILMPSIRNSKLKISTFLCLVLSCYSRLQYTVVGGGALCLTPSRVHRDLNRLREALPNSSRTTGVNTPEFLDGINPTGGRFTLSRLYTNSNTNPVDEKTEIWDRA